MSEQSPISGLLVIDKPPACTSHDVVARVRRTLATSKVGHAGTLDPSATGVLLVGVGKATRILQFLQNLAKEYRATVQLGVVTDSQDADGQVVSSTECDMQMDQVREAAERFVGEIAQIPPMVSAVKVGGERLYKAARRGEVVEREPRTVRVYALQVEDFDRATQEATLYVKCSSGTFVRTLAADLGEILGCGAHVKGLRRLAIGSFTEAEAVPLDELEGEAPAEAANRVLPMHAALRDFPSRTVEGDEYAAVSHGRPLEVAGDAPKRLGELPVMSAGRGDRPAHEAGMTAGIPVAIRGPEGQLIAVYRRSSGKLKPAAVLM
ncbi:MAG: tRNA pseudouridine(55) synthase TruB [Actinomycetota bacterium]